jgi:uncharacterized protein YdiU (UPF0061 family)
MLVGFIHGVLNTDNTSIAAETIDYGPCAFLDGYHPDKVFSSIDQFGRYAFSNQPAIIKWNLARFAETLLPLMAADRDKAVEAANSSIALFDAHYNQAYLKGLRQKLGFALEMEDDYELASDLLRLMAENQADFTLTFRNLSDASSDAGAPEVRALFANPSAFDAWAIQWRQRLSLEQRSTAERRAGMLAVNPMFIPRNHRIEAAIADAEVGKSEKFNEIVNVLARPYNDQPEFADYANPPAPEEEVRQTFCGT